MYTAAGGDPTLKVDLRKIEADLKFEGTDLRDAYMYLTAEGLIRGAMNGMTSANITHDGRKEVEQKRDDSAAPTTHFTINVGGDVHGSFTNVVGNNNVTTVNHNVNDLPTEVQDLASQLRKADGGNDSPETEAFIKAITADEPNKFIIAAATEKVIEKGGVHKELVTGFGKGIAEGVGKMVPAAAGAATGWLVTHGAIVLAGIRFLLGI